MAKSAESKRGVTAAQIRNVIALTEPHASARLTIAAACRRVGISPASFYRARARNDRRAPRYAAIEADWRELKGEYNPRLPFRAPAAAVRDIRELVGEAFKFVYSRPAHSETAKQIADGLDRFGQKLIRLIAGYEDLSDQGKSALEVAATMGTPQGLVLGETIQLLKGLAELLPEVAAAIAEDRSARSGGGPVHDTRTRTIVLRLATLFAGYLQRHPTDWRKADGTPDSAFNRFTLHAFEHFLGEKSPPTSALTDAMDWVVQWVDFDDDVAGES
jgi:hypothetical protein